MRLSNRTMEVLKNFANINTTLSFSAGDVIRVMAPSGTFVGEAKVEETFFRDFIIYDLNQLIALLNLSKEPDLDLQDGFAVVNGEARYWYADPRLPAIAKPKSVTFPSEDVTFDLPRSTFERVYRASMIMSLPEISIQSKDNGILLCAVDTKNPSGNNIEVPVGAPDGANGNLFSVFLSASNMQLLRRDYKVALSTKRVVRFQSQQEPDNLSLSYFTATLKHSTFNKPTA